MSEIKMKMNDGKIRLAEAHSIKNTKKKEFETEDIKIIGYFIFDIKGSDEILYLGMKTNGDYLILEASKLWPVTDSYLFNDFPEYEAF